MSSLPVILLAINNLERGGAQSLLVSYLRHQQNAQFRFVVVSLGSPNDLRVDIEQLGVQVDVVKVNSRYEKKQIANLRSYIQTIDPVIIHSHTDTASFAVRIAASGITSIRHIAHYHNAYHRRYSAAYSDLESHLAPVTNSYLACSKSVEEFVTKTVGVPEESIQTIENGTDVIAAQKARANRTALREKFKIPDDCIHLIHVSRLVALKRPERVVQAIRNLAGQNSELPKWRLTFLGEGHHRPVLEKEIQNCPEEIRQNIHMMGNRQDVPDWLASADLFVSFSEREGLPISVIEAMTVGLPSLVCDIPSMLHLIEDQKTGLIVGLDDLEMSEIALRKLITDSALRNQLGQHALVESEKYDIQTHINRMDVLYDSLQSMPSNMKKMGFFEKRSFIAKTTRLAQQMMKLYQEKRKMENSS